MDKRLNKEMLNSDNLLADNIDIYDKNGNQVATVPLDIAKKLVDTGRYRVDFTSDISFL